MVDNAILDTVLSLNEDARAELIDRLIASFEPATYARLSETALAEIDRRSREIESGVVQPLTEEEFYREIGLE